MQSLFDPQTAADIRQRLQSFQPDSVRQWGKMTAGQTMAHLHEALKVATGDSTLKPNFIGKLLGPMIKRTILSEKPFKQGLPTSPGFLMKEEKEFLVEKEKLMKTFEKFVGGGIEGAKNRVHPLFGKFSAEEWGMSQWKHFDHHLRQWGR